MTVNAKHTTKYIRHGSRIESHFCVAKVKCKLFHKETIFWYDFFTCKKEKPSTLIKISFEGYFISASMIFFMAKAKKEGKTVKLGYNNKMFFPHLRIIFGRKKSIRVRMIFQILTLALA